MSKEPASYTTVAEVNHLLQTHGIIANDPALMLMFSDWLEEQGRDADAENWRRRERVSRGTGD
jgi:uncharacterized protein (TIGR02996 family)